MGDVRKVAFLLMFGGLLSMDCRLAAEQSQASPAKVATEAGVNVIWKDIRDEVVAYFKVSDLPFREEVIGRASRAEWTKSKEGEGFEAGGMEYFPEDAQRRARFKISSAGGGTVISVWIYPAYDKKRGGYRVEGIQVRRE